MPRLIPRSEWGNRYGVGWRVRALPATSAWLHHSVTNAPGPNATLAEDIAHMRLLDQIGYNRFSYADKGWSRPAGAGISYTAVVMPSGRIFEGHDVNRASSHTSGYNTPGIGICLAGNFDLQEPTAAALDSAAWALTEFKRRGQLRTARFNGGHRDTGFATSCPGNRLHSKLGRINAIAAQHEAGAAPDVPVVKPPPPPPVEDPLKGFTPDHLAHVDRLLTDLGYTGDDVWAKTTAYQTDHGLAVDGLPGTLQTTPHIEDTMNKIDQLTAAVAEVKNALVGPNAPRDPFNPDTGARVPMLNLAWANGHRGSETNGRLRQLEATTEGYRVALQALATNQGLDAEQIRTLVEDGVDAALTKVEADVRLTINTGQEG